MGDPRTRPCRRTRRGSCGLASPRRGAPGRTGRLRIAAAFPLGLALLGVAAPALGVDLDRRTEPLEIPDFQPDARPPSPLLPPLPPGLLPSDSARDPVPGQRIRSVRFEGRRALPASRLEPAIAPAIGRPTSHENLERLRGAVTRIYVEAGYVNSGARAVRVGPDGALVVEIVEGRIGRIDHHGGDRIPRFFVESGLRVARGDVLNLFELEERARILRRDPRIEDVRLHVEPGADLGVASLRIDVVEARPWFVSLEASNHQSPTVGAEVGELRVGSLNLVGLGDRLELRGRLGDGLWELGGEYDVPVTPWLGRLRVGGRVLRAEVVEFPFDVLDIESEQEGAWVRLEQTVFESLQHRHDVSLSLDWTRSRSTIFGQPLDVFLGPIGDPTTVSGNSEAWVLRARHAYTYRGRRFAFSLSNTLSRGLDVFGATRREGGRADGEFLSWLGRSTAALRVGWLDSLLLTRFDVQLASQSLLGFEQLPVGGAYSVRGYRENQLVRDNGLAGSVEWRVPLRLLPSRSARLWVFPFFDYGRSWLKHPRSEPYEWIYSVGAGLRFELAAHLVIDLAWAKGLRGAEDGLSGDLQDSGGHFRVLLRWP